MVTRPTKNAGSVRTPTKQTLGARAAASPPNGFWLAAHMDKADVSDETLAEFMRVERQTVWKWKVGKTEPDKQTRDRIAEFFHIAEVELWNPPGFVDLNAAARHIKDDRLRQKLAEWLRDYPTN